MIDNLKKMFGQSDKFISICAPFSGKLSSIEDISDDIFSKGTLGLGIAITPNDDEKVVKSPVGGEVLLISDMSHAVMIRVKEQAEILIHIGIGTIALKGKHFTPIVKNGDFIKAGDPLLRFDQKAIKNEGFSMKTAIVVPTLGNYTKIEVVDKSSVACQEEIIKLIKN